MGSPPEDGAASESAGRQGSDRSRPPDAPGSDGVSRSEDRGAPTPAEGRAWAGAPRPGAYEDVRERLVALGYLNRPLERFVLSALTRPGSFPRRHAAVSARVALAAGPPLGLLFALAVVVVNRPILSRPLDLILLAMIYAIAFGAAVFALEFATGLALAVWVRWRVRGVAALQAAALRAGFSVSLLLSAYLALWWRRRAGAGEGWLLDLAGLAALLVVNAGLLRVSSLASLAALVRASDLRSVETARRSRGGILAIAAALILAVGFFLAPGGSRSRAPAVFERLPVPGRLLVVGWDGMAGEKLRERIARGESKLGDRLLRGSALARIAPADEGPALSRPAFWTGIATGRGRAEHGVGEIELERVPGLSSPLGGDVPFAAALRLVLPGRHVAVSAGVRRAKTLWEILGEKEGVGAVGWWATWPASDTGTLERPFAIVSDRTLFGLRFGGERSGGGASIGPDLGVVPPTLARRLIDSRGTRFAEIDLRLRDAFPPTDLAPVTEPGRIDGYSASVAAELLGDARIADLFVYLPGLDIYRSPRETPRAAEPTAAVSSESLERYAAYAEGLIADLASRSSGASDWIVVIGDAGRDSASNGGWALLAGPGVSAGSPAEVWNAGDVAPTLLNLRGFPTSAEMKGRVHTDFLVPEWGARLRPRVIATYGERVPPEAPPGEGLSEEEMLERLRSLGYVQ